MERMASGFRNDVNNLTVGKISAEEAKRREQISQQKRIEAFEKSKKIKRPASHEKLLIEIKKQEAEKRKLEAEKKKLEAEKRKQEAEKKKQEAEKKRQEAEKKKQRYDRNLKKFAKMADRRGKTLKF